MDEGEKYSPGFVLTEMGDELRRHHSELRVSLPSNRFTYQQGLNATLDCVCGLPDYVSLPTTNAARRQALRLQAQENMRALEDAKAFSSRQIRGSGKLKPGHYPRPLSPDGRAQLKHKFLGENEPPFRKPYILGLHALRTDDTLASIIGNAKIYAVDFEEGMPKCNLDQIEMLWDTGAATTIITKDLLDEQFQSHLSDPIHSPYVGSDGTRVQVSVVLDFTNSLLEMNLIAWVVDKEAVPNGRSGIILGQNGCINALQYRSIPRSILEAQGQAVDERFWGDLILERFVDLDGSLKEI